MGPYPEQQHMSLECVAVGKSQDRHKISFAFEFNDKKYQKSLQGKSPPPYTIKLDLSLDI